MTTWEFGLEEAPLAAILTGRKTIEGRLSKGKFAEFKSGDTVSVRADFRDTKGVRHDGKPGVAILEIIAIRRYSNFAEMVKAEGFENIASVAGTFESTVFNYEKYYSQDEQAKYGVLAIEIKPIA